MNAMTNNRQIDFEQIDFDDIQGLVRFGHGQLPASAFLLLTITDSAAAKRWLASAPITTAAAQKPLPDTALQVAFSAAGLHQLGIATDIIGQFSLEFTAGMTSDPNRSRRLGDTGSNAPQHWQWGCDASGNTPHLMLMVYAQHRQLESTLDTLQGELFAQAFAVQTSLISPHSRSTEPFGFEDGISQPLIDWEQTLSTDVHQRDSYANRVALGEILLGYRNEYGLYTERPLLDADNSSAEQVLPQAEDQPRCCDLGRNGTYLVFRQLEQDVGGFWQFVDRQAAGDADKREALAAAMVGRKRDGTPLVDAAEKPIDGIAADNSKNHFNYDKDPLGHGCPIGAHVRRSNPRTGDYPAGVTGLFTRLIRTLGFCRRHAGDDLVASSRFHRLLRRGRIYGTEISVGQALLSHGRKPVAGDERGLHFICLCANIARQFEFVQSAWNMSSKFAGLPTESDPLLGNREPLLNGHATNRFTLPQQGSPAQCIEGLPRFVTVKGGAYFFMPGLKALKYISS